jgi:hypothetical protein
VVVCEKRDDMFIANSLKSSTFPNRRMHQLIYEIVHNLGNIEPKQLIDYKEEIQVLNRSEAAIQQKQHPIVKSWLNKYLSPPLN